MVNAVVSGGEIRPLEPLPADWKEGQHLRIEKAEDSEPTVEAIDRDFALLEGLCTGGDTADDECLLCVLDEAHRQAKEQVRKQMGLA